MGASNGGGVVRNHDSEPISCFIAVYNDVKKIEDMFIHFDRIHERGRQTDRHSDGHRMTTKATLAYSTRGKNQRS